jgi:hypothetical protein
MAMDDIGLDHANIGSMRRTKSAHLFFQHTALTDISIAQLIF